MPKVSQLNEITTSGSNSYLYILDTSGSSKKIKQSNLLNKTYSSEYSSPPSNPNPGDIWMPTDSFYTFRYNGANWIPYRENRVMTLPVDGDFSWDNEVGVTKTVDGGAISLALDNRNFEDIRVRYKTAPSTPYTITTAMCLNSPANQWGVAYFGFREASSGKLDCIIYGGGQLSVINYNSPTSFNSWRQQWNSPGHINTIWLRISDDGTTNKVFYMSVDGYHFYTLLSVSRTSFFTPDQVWWGGQGGNIAPIITLFSWAES